METLELCPELRNTLPWEGASCLILTLRWYPRHLCLPPSPTQAPTGSPASLPQDEPIFQMRKLRSTVSTQGPSCPLAGSPQAFRRTGDTQPGQGREV